MKPLIIEEEADLEFEEAAERYDAEDPSLADRFVQNVLAVIESVHRSPREWPLAPTIPDRFGVRRRLVPGFPFSVVYKELETAIWVVAVAHGKRRPGSFASECVSLRADLSLTGNAPDLDLAPRFTHPEPMGRSSGAELAMFGLAAFAAGGCAPPSATSVDPVARRLQLRSLTTNVGSGLASVETAPNL